MKYNNLKYNLIKNMISQRTEVDDSQLIEVAGNVKLNEMAFRDSSTGWVVSTAPVAYAGIAGISKGTNGTTSIVALLSSEVNYSALASDITDVAAVDADVVAKKLVPLWFDTVTLKLTATLIPMTSPAATIINKVNGEYVIRFVKGQVTV